MIQTFLDDTRAVIGGLDPGDIDRMVAALRQVREQRGRLFLIGNGGGAGHASHAAADFRKIAKIEAYAWGDNVSDLTAYTNDYSWDAAIMEWLADSHCRPGDAVLTFSVGGGSGTVSSNLTAAIGWAKLVGAEVLGVVGAEGGEVAKRADSCIRIPSTSTPQVEGVQAVIWHCLVTELAC